jgi:hypothetical protein
VGVIIGMDPHKRSATIGIVDERAAVLAAGRFATDKAGYAQMLAAGGRFGGRMSSRSRVTRRSGPKSRGRRGGVARRDGARFGVLLFVPSAATEDRPPG